MSIQPFTSNTLREHRKRHGLLQTDVARVLGLDCADRISHWENGIAMPSIVNLFRLAAVYGVLPHELNPGLYGIDKELDSPTKEV